MSLGEVHGDRGLGFRPFRTMGQMRPYQVLGFPGRIRAFLECLASLVSQGQSDPMAGEGRGRWAGRKPLESPRTCPALASGLKWSPEPVCCEQPTH